MSRSKQRPNLKNAPPISVIILLVAFILLAFGFIGFRQLQGAQDRRLRLLAGFSERIESTVQDLADRFVRVVRVEKEAELGPEPGAAPSDPRSSSEGQRFRQLPENAVEAYLDNVPHLALVSNSNRGETCDTGGRTEGDANQGLIDLRARNRFAYLRYCPPREATETGGTTAPSESRPAGGGAPSSTSSPATAGDGLTGPDRGGDRFLTYRAHIDLQELIEPMILPGVFDSLVLTNRTGDVLFQEGEPELRMAGLAAVLQAGADDEAGGLGLDRVRDLARQSLSSRDQEAIEPLLQALDAEGGNPNLAAGTGMAKVQIADRDYYVFFQPVQPRVLPPRRHRTGPPAHWVAVGLISSENLLSSGLTTSPVMLFVLVSILPLALVAWPFLKLRLITRRQRFNRVDLASLLFATVIGVSLVTFLLLDLLFLARLRETVDDQLEHLSDAIRSQFVQEVGEAYGQLRETDRELRDADGRLQLANPPGQGSADPALCRPISTGRARSRGLDRPVRELDHLEPVQSITDYEEMHVLDPAEHYLRNRVQELLENKRLSFDRYPAFDSVFWATRWGHHACATIPLRRHAILPANVRDRDYFRCAVECEPGPVSPPIEASGGPLDWPCPTDAKGGTPVCLQSVLDRTTGESVAVLAIPSPDPQNAVFPMAAMVARLASVGHPMLPPEVGFAIVDTSGRVLFHSDARRELTENFLKASDEDSLLASLLRERRDGHLTLSYWGQRSRAHVLPLDGLPWSLVTFRNLNDLRVRNFELIYDFLNPYLLFLGIYGLLAGLLLWSGRRTHRISLWPSARNLPLYRRIVSVTPLVLLVLALLILWTDQPEWVFVASLAAPLPLLAAALLPTRLTLGRRRGTPDRPAERSEAEGTADATQADRTEETGGPQQKLSWWNSVRERQPRAARPLFLLLLAGALAPLLINGSRVIPTFLFGLTAATAASAFWWRLEFDGSRRKTAYVLAAGSLVIVVAMVPALGFFSLARSRQTQLLTQEAQVSLARRVAQRAAEIEDRSSPLHGRTDQVPRYAGLDRIRDDYLCALFDTWIEGSSNPCPRWQDRQTPADTPPPWAFGIDPDPAGNPLRQWTELTLSARPLPLNTLSARPVRADLSRYRFKSGDWRWNGERGLALEHSGLFGTGPERHLVSAMPPTGTLQGLPVLYQALLLLGFFAVAASPSVLARFISRELLLVDLVGAPAPSRSGNRDDRTPGAPDQMTEKIASILWKAQETSEVVRRFVLVSTLPDREAWKELVAEKPQDPIIKGSDEEHPKPSDPYVEASFAMCWRAVANLDRKHQHPSAGQEPDGPEEMGGGSESVGSENGADGANGAQATDDLEAGAPPGTTRRSRAFARRLAPDEPPTDSEERKNWTSRPILLLDFQPELEDELAAADQIAALKELIDQENRSVIILSDQILDLGLEESTGVAVHGPESVRSRWIELLGTFSVRYGQDYRERALARRAEWVLTKIRETLEALTDPADRRSVRRMDGIVRQVAEECAPTPILWRIGYDLLGEVEQALGSVENAANGADGKEQSYDDPHRAWHLLEQITREYVIVKVGTEARLHYRHLWNSCTRDEKLVLVQLAEHGIVNPKYLGWVSDLMNRGLVTRDPALRLMNESFERFVHQEVQRSEIIKWVEEGGPSAWSVLKWILPIPLVGLAAFLFITQQNALSSLAGIAVAAASLAPFVINLYNKVQEINLRGDTDDGSPGS